jgi:hypothetical protein
MARRVSLNHVSVCSHHPVACGNQGSLTRVEMQHMGFTQRGQNQICVSRAVDPGTFESWQGMAWNEWPLSRWVEDAGGYLE